MCVSKFAAMLAAACALQGQTAIEPRIVSETLPSGGMMQIKLDLTTPHPITSTRARFAMDESAFGEVEGVSIFSPSGDAYGVAVVRNGFFTSSLVSPQISLGTQLDYPYLVVATRIKPGLSPGRQFPINFDAFTLFIGPGGSAYTMPFPHQGVLTIGGSISITNVIPGGGQLAAGATVRLLGTGFNSDTRVDIGEIAISDLTLVSSTELTFRVNQATDLTGRRIRARNDDGSDVTYYSYLRPIAVGASSSALLNACHPVYANAMVTSASLALPAAPASGFIGVALQNSTLAPANVEFELVSAGGVTLGRSSIAMPAASRYLRTVTELFSVNPGPNALIRMVATGSPVQLLGIRADEADSTATAFAAGPLTNTRIVATPTALSFQYVPGGAAPAPQAVQLDGSTNSVAFSALSSASWLTVTPSSGQTSASVSATVDPAGFGNGQQTATITLTAANTPPVVIPVVLNIGATPPSPPSLLSPIAGQTGVSPATTLTWSAANGATSYDVYLGTSNPPPLLLNTTGLSATPSGNLIAGQLYYWQVVARNASGSAASAVAQFTTAPPTTTSGSQFVPVNPCRLVDTRNAAGPYGGPILTRLGTRTFDLKSHPCLAGADPLAYSLNVTVVPVGPMGYLTVWPAGTAQPVVSTLNSLDGRIKANAAIVAGGVNRAISVFATDDVHVIIDVTGYFAASGGLAFYPLAPCRVADTRNAVGPLGGLALASQETRSFPVRSSACGVPANAQAYSLNATVVPRGPFGFLTVWPSGQSQPVVSTLNALTGTVTANAAIVRAGTNGDISVFATDATDLILDINGYFAPPGAAGALFFTPTGPCRILDTRNTGILAAASPMSVPVTACAGASVSTARAYTLNATVIPPGAFGYLTLWPQGSTQPVVSTLNALDGALTSNLAIVPANTAGGGILAFGSSVSHLLLDSSGYFAP
ncbi:hypothetical protein F183_A44330 [Bryobacterales bacterium F-183]|nr:hypothetical protein F183_A44330 [Bryobacterales bacterium F-183]